MNLLETNAESYLSIKRGDTFRLTFKFNSPGSNQPLDLTGSSARLSLKSVRSGLSAIDATTDNGLLILIPLLGTVKLDIPAQYMNIDAGRYQFDLELTLSNGTVISSDTRYVNIVQDITSVTISNTSGYSGVIPVSMFSGYSGISGYSGYSGLSVANGVTIAPIEGMTATNVQMALEELYRLIVPG